MIMTVSELKKQLNNFSDDLTVVIGYDDPSINSYFHIDIGDVELVYTGVENLVVLQDAWQKERKKHE